MGDVNTPIFEVFCLTSRKSSRRFPQISGPVSRLTPVRFPPGRLKLSTRPKPMGSVTAARMGIVVVTAFTSRAMETLMTTIAPGLSSATARATSA